jgi:predicted MPP superfamily phosphohydrolase
MNNTLTWLHLSDLHLCSDRTGWKANKVIDTLKQDLLEMKQQQQLKPDLLFFTGDLAYGQLGSGDLSIQAQFEQVHLLITEICQIFSLSTQQVFIVAGNHDVNRSCIGEMPSIYLETITKKSYDESVEKVNAMLNSANQDWQQFMPRLNDYKIFIQKYYPHLLQDEKRLTYAIEKQINSINVGIAGFNSAWSCSKENEKGNLWLGGKWQINTLSEKINNCDIKIALAHHPLTWLVPQENPALDPIFRTTI